MRKRLWKIDSVFVDLEDRDAAVSLIHEKSLSEVVVKFRLSPRQLDDNAMPLRKRIEILAADLILDLGSFLDTVPDWLEPKITFARPRALNRDALEDVALCFARRGSAEWLGRFLTQGVRLSCL